MYKPLSLKKRWEVGVEGQKVVVVGQEIYHILKKSLVNAFIVTRRVTLKRTVLPKKWTKGSEQSEKDDTNNTTTTLDHEVTITASVDEECLSVADDQVEWNVGTVVYHPTLSREMFMMYKVGFFGTMKIGNTSYLKTIGIGDIYIETKVGCTMMFKDVQQVLGLRLNLIPGTTSDCASYVSYFENGRWKLKRGPLIIERRVISSTRYMWSCVKVYSMLLKTIHLQI